MATTYLTRTPSSAGNRKVFTFSAWIKSSGESGDRTLFSAGVSPRLALQINSSNEIKTDIAGIGAYNESNSVLRDTAGWYHVVWKFDTTQATANDRSIIYVNGEAIDDKNTRTFSQNTDYSINTTEIHRIGALTNVLTHYFNGSMAHVHFIDGTAYDASAFGQTDSTTGQWKPKISPSVTYGTNGFFLKFASSGSMGTDSSGNGNNFTVSGSLTQTQDTPSNVFACYNILDYRVSSSTSIKGTFANLNNTVTGTASGLSSVTNSTFAMTTGKWYAEFKYIENPSITNNRIGILNKDTWNNSAWPLNNDGYGYRATDGQKESDGTTSAYGATYTTNDIIGVAFDATNGTLTFYKNGSSQGQAFSGIPSGNWVFMVAPLLDTTIHANFGNGYFGTTAVSSANSDDAGYGLFEYAPPTGYYSLCTRNINTYG